MRWLFALFPVALADASAACTDQTPCPLGDRSYHVREPDNWDGVTPLPVLLHFHGWGRQGTLIVRHNRIASGTRTRGVLLLAPNGLNRSWRFFQPGSSDTQFARAVLEDAATRYPIDPDQIFVSGYSWGANMAWRFACEDGADIAGLLAISGTLDQFEDCATAPTHIRQVFGLADNVLRFPMGPGEDQTYPVKLWRDHKFCGDTRADGPWNARSFLTFERYSWNCATGSVALDVHPGGHFIPHDWIAHQLDDLLSSGAQ